MSDAELTRAMIVNWALAEIGVAANFSEDSETSMGGTVDMFWPRAQARAFGLHDWSFLRKTRKLTRHAATPENGYAYGFDMPGDAYGPVLKLLSDPRRNVPLRDYTIEADGVYADVPDVWARIKVARPVEEWWPQFADGFAMLLASYLAVPLLQDEELAAIKLQAAVGSGSEGGGGGLFGRLNAQDRAGAPVGAPQSGSGHPLDVGRAVSR